MSSNAQVAAAIEVAKTTGLPIYATMTFDMASRSMMGVMPADFAEFAGGLGANFTGANCGIPAYVEGAIHYHGTPELVVEYALFARDSGTKVILGCCGTSPAHVEAMVAALDTTSTHDFDKEAIVSALGEA